MTGSPYPTISLPKLTLIIGGARSGKSRLAERLVSACGCPRTYIATAQGWDDEMRARIARHLTDRGDGWQTIEAPLDLPQVLQDVSADRVVLLDCATLWLSNQMLAEAERIALACFDVDGTLTDGRLFFDTDGRELKAFHVHDGQGLVLLRKAGIDPFQRASLLELISSDAGGGGDEPPTTGNRALAPVPGDGVRLPQTIKPIQVPSTEVRAEQSHAADIMRIQRDLAKRRCHALTHEHAGDGLTEPADDRVVFGHNEEATRLARGRKALSELTGIKPQETRSPDGRDG